ncbi:hypothetical protein IWQ60_011059 [Tieghemiomyces parasiticus]|uniref:Uncharacterized protein n=1 Tax=Tieghemiomyces parasiticus TaxID=78921 RepID=A0A9W7ZNU6_9FUNG|nr:hypothetical protein IWQ60_011059 [Tieghemiomyces parasiticus]
MPLDSFANDKPRAKALDGMDTILDHPFTSDSQEPLGPFATLPTCAGQEEKENIYDMDTLLPRSGPNLDNKAAAVADISVPSIGQDLPHKPRRGLIDRFRHRTSLQGADDENPSVRGTEPKPVDSEPAGEKDPTISLAGLFRFATPFDWFLMGVGSICAVAAGASPPLMTIVFSNTLQGLSSYAADNATDHDLAVDNLNIVIYDMLQWFGILSGATFASAYLEVFCWSYAGERQCRRMRELYYESILRQEVGWFDTVSTGDLTSRISGDVNIVQEGISSKFGRLIHDSSCFVAGFVIAFSKGWRLALVLLSALPLLVLCGIIIGKLVASQSNQGQGSYGKAGGVATEAISGIRTVMAFGGQEREISRYGKQVDLATRAGVRRSYIAGIGVGAIMGIIFLTYALGFWYSIKLASENTLTGAQALTVFFALIIGAMTLGQTAPGITALAKAQGAATKVFGLIARVSLIDPLDHAGQQLDAPKGRIEFHNLRFSYPARPDVPILKGFSLTVEPGQTVALVGASGSGKSTVVSLLERFYDPQDGDILIDDINIKRINVRSLRSHIGIVSQEPVLFGKTVRQNILWGAMDDYDGTITDADIEKACRDANAWDFIQHLQYGLDTPVGEKGSLLSGGQKQRVAIARAIIRNPRILLLDEATSALDSKSERVVQDALDRVARSRTTIVIAHRLSTIRDSDKIVVVHLGEVVEMGTHNSLLAENKVYAQLVRAQALKKRDNPAAADLALYEDGEVPPPSDSDFLDRPLESSYASGQPWSRPSLTSSDRVLTAPDDSSGVILASNKPADKDGKALPAKRRQPHKSGEDPVPDDEEIQVELERKRLVKNPIPFRRLARLAMPEKWFIIPAVFLAAIDGAILPLFSIVFTKVLVVFGNVANPYQMRTDGNLYACLLIAFAGVASVAAFGRVTLFGVAGEHLTNRVRMMSFRAIVNQDAAFFDDRANGTGILCSKLATESERINILGGSMVGVIIQSVATLAIGFALAFSGGWQLTLVVMACLPLSVISNIFEMKAISGFDEKTKKAYDKAAQVATETIANLRTVAALCRERMFITMFRQTNDQPHRDAVRGFIINGIGSGFSQSQMFIMMIVSFYYGSRLIIWGTYTVEEMFQVFNAITFAALGLAQAGQTIGDASKAKVAALSLFELVDRVPTIDARSLEGRNVDFLEGTVDTHEVDFHYPTNVDLQILYKINFEALPGQTVALVGNSGSGKSTIIALVQRLYDVTAGNLSVDRMDAREWNVQGLRSHLAIVGQEPVLFDLSVRENIAYGKPDATDAEVEAAARSANIHDFIMSLPAGYDTEVGERGGKLSGGQKQRLAIARALVRNPKLLLLDEATSALDSQSEKLVQETLDRAAQGRTTLTIAHRLSTIQNADMIVVFENGRIVERGTHFDLVDQRGLYHSLVSEQSLEART